MREDRHALERNMLCCDHDISGNDVRRSVTERRGPNHRADEDGTIVFRCQLRMPSDDRRPDVRTRLRDLGHDGIDEFDSKSGGDDKRRDEIQRIAALARDVVRVDMHEQLSGAFARAHDRIGRNRKERRVSPTDKRRILADSRADQNFRKRRPAMAKHRPLQKIRRQLPDKRISIVLHSRSSSPLRL